MFNMASDKRHGRIFLLGIIGFILILTLAGLILPGPFRLGELTDVSFVALSDGQVLTYNATSGNWTNGYANDTAVNMTLSELSDVFIDSIQNNQIIQYNSTSLMWENRDLSSSSDSYAVSNLTDVSIVGLANGQILQYNSTSTVWENVNPATWSISTLTDVSLNGLSDLQILQYNATSLMWENRAIPAQALAGLTDVSISVVSNNQILQYNSTSGKWENMNLQTWAISTLTDVSLIGLSNGQILAYNDTSAKWENQNQNSYAVSNLTDVTLLGLSDGQLLKYNSTSGKWENSDADTWSISTLTDVTLSNLNDLQIIQYNNTSGKWENEAIPAQALSELSDVTFSGLINGQVVQYNSTSGEWENESPTVWALSLLSDVNITSVAHNQILQYDAVSAKWINVNAPNGTYVSANPPWYDSSLVGYWQLNEGSGATAFDDGGNANTGTITGALWVDGKYGKALSFDGENDYVEVPYNATFDFSTGSFTIAFGLKHLDTASDRRIVSKAGGKYYDVMVASEGKIAFGLSDLVGNPWAVTPLAYDDNIEHFIVAVRDVITHTICVYVDGGEKVNVTDTTSDLSEVNIPLQIGARTGIGQYAKGAIDEVRIYNRALSQTEISVLFAGGLQSYAGQLWMNTTNSVLYVRNNNNSAWNFVSAPIQGFGITTPSFPSSETDITNTNPFPVRIYILTVGTTIAYNITDTFGTMMNVETPLYAGMEITLDYLEKIRFTYSAAPVWRWYGTG